MDIENFGKKKEKDAIDTIREIVNEESPAPWTEWYHEVMSKAILRLAVDLSDLDARINAIEYQLGPVHEERGIIAIKIHRIEDRLTELEKKLEEGK